MIRMLILLATAIAIGFSAVAQGTKPVLPVGKKVAVNLLKHSSASDGAILYTLSTNARNVLLGSANLVPDGDRKQELIAQADAGVIMDSDIDFSRKLKLRLLMSAKAGKLPDDQFNGEWTGDAFPIADNQAGAFYRRWDCFLAEALVEDVRHDPAYRAKDLSSLPGFHRPVTEKPDRGSRTSAEEAPGTVKKSKDFAPQQ